MLRSNRSFIFWLIMTLFFMIVIYLLSSQPYPDQDLRPTMRLWITPEQLQSIIPHVEFAYGGGLVTWKRPYDFAEFFIRKGAHAVSYFILTLLLLKMLSATRLRSSAVQLSAFGISLLFAASDEWHQTLVPNRTGHAIDVAVDCTGIITAMLLHALFIRSNARGN